MHNFIERIERLKAILEPLERQTDEYMDIIQDNFPDFDQLMYKVFSNYRKYREDEKELRRQEKEWYNEQREKGLLD